MRFLVVWGAILRRRLRWQAWYGRDVLTVAWMMRKTLLAYLPSSCTGVLNSPLQTLWCGRLLTDHWCGSSPQSPCPPLISHRNQRIFIFLFSPITLIVSVGWRAAEEWSRSRGQSKGASSLAVEIGLPLEEPSAITLNGLLPEWEYEKTSLNLPNVILSLHKMFSVKIEKRKEKKG